MRAVELDPVESATRRVLGRDGEVIDYLRYLVGLEHLRRLGADRSMRGSQKGVLRPVGTALGAAVRQLNECERTVLVDRIGHAPKVWNRLIDPSHSVVAHRICRGRMDVGVTDEHNPGSTCRPIR